jgi:glycosyltransferase involved in cell wall biosynthesis
MESEVFDSKLPITVLILTKNEENAIRKCLESTSIFQQVIVIDSNSSDSTVRISQEMGAQVINFSWNGRYPKKKQWSKELEIIENEWILYLDADERLSEELKSELGAIFKANSWIKYSAFEIPLQYKFLGNLLLHGHQVKKIALVRKANSDFPELDDLRVGNMWEVEGHYQPIIDGQVGRLTGKLIHDDPDPLFNYFERHNKYSDWETELKFNSRLQSQVRSHRTKQGRIFDFVPIKPLAFFLYSYVLRSGWRDGKSGFHYAVALSFYYWQISLKVLEREQNERTF